MSKEQRKFYNHVRDQILKSDFEEVEQKVKQANILANLTYLREVCDSCELIDPEVNSSAKMKECKRLVGELIENGHKIVIFSQYEKMTRLIERDLGFPAIRLHGGISTEKGVRDKMTYEFADSKIKNVFIMTTAGGEGINLQCADYIIFFDLPFNPQVIAQVEDRLHRKGQEATVNVIKLIAKDTIEDRVLEILKFKTKLFKEVIDGQVSSEGILNQKELLNAVRST
jgi:SNF2 family DNA or RNA helicase